MCMYSSSTTPNFSAFSFATASSRSCTTFSSLSGQLATSSGTVALRILRLRTGTPTLVALEGASILLAIDDCVDDVRRDTPDALDAARWCPANSNSPSCSSLASLISWTSISTLEARCLGIIRSDMAAATLA